MHHHKHTSIWDHVVEGFVTQADRVAVARTGTRHRSALAYWRSQILRPSLLRRLSPSHHRRAVVLVSALVLICGVVGFAFVLAAILAFILGAAGYGALWRTLRIPIAIYVVVALAISLVSIAAGAYLGPRHRAALTRRALRTRFLRAPASSPTDVRPERLAKEHAARADFWRGTLSRRNRLTAFAYIPLDPVVLTLNTALFLPYGIAAILLLLLADQDPTSVPSMSRHLPSPFYLLAGLVAIYTLGYFRFRAIRARLLASLNTAACPDCAYDLASTFYADDPRRHTPWAAPRRCPECGSPWPLIPPPIPSHHTPEGIAKANQSLWTRNILLRSPKTKPPHHPTR